MAETPSPRASGALALARRIIIPRFKVEGATVHEAFKELMSSARYPDGQRRVHLALSGVSSGDRDVKITLDLENVTLADAAGQFARSADLKLYVDSFRTADLKLHVSLLFMSKKLGSAGLDMPPGTSQITYGFDDSFVQYFGPEGVAEVEKALGRIYSYQPRIDTNKRE